MAKESVKGILDARKALDKALAKEQKTQLAYNEAIDEAEKAKETYKKCLEDAKVAIK